MNENVWPLILLGGGLLAFLLAVSFLSKNYSLNNFKSKTVGDGQHGTARWATPREISKTYRTVPFRPRRWRKGEELPTEQGLGSVGGRNHKSEGGFLLKTSRKLLEKLRRPVEGKRKTKKKSKALSKVKKMIEEQRDIRALVDSDDVHCLMIGASGVGKTAFFLYPNLEYACACGMSYLALDTKGDLARNYGCIASKYYGYQVTVIDLRNPTCSDGFNFMTLVNHYMDRAKRDPNDLTAKAKAENYAKILAKTIISPEGSSQYGDNAFFYESAEGVLAAIVMLLAEFILPEKDGTEKRHIVSAFKLVQDLLAAPGGGRGKNGFHVLMDMLPSVHKARWVAGAALTAADQAMASVMSTVLSKLNAFLDSELEQVICRDNPIDAERFASSKCAIFVVIPEEDPTKNFIASLMIQNLSRELFSVADENRGRLKNRVVLFCDELGTMPPFDILPLFSAGRSRRLTLVPIIQSLAQLEKNYGKEGAEIICDNCQDTIFGGFAPNSQTAEVLSKALGSRTVLSGSVSRGKNDPSQSLQMMERALLTPDELKSIPKGSFIVMKTGTHPMRTRLQLFLNWGITFGEPYVVPERANRAVAYANRVDLDRNLPQLSEPEEMDESRGYAVSSRGGIAHAPAQERAVKRGKQMKTFGEEER